MNYILSIIFFYLFLAIVVRIWKSTKRNDIKNWLPSRYKQEFNTDLLTKGSLIDKGNERPSGHPILFIIGSFRTQNNSISTLDDFANLITFGWLNFSGILPLGSPLDLRLYLKNISKNDVIINSSAIKFFIRYPGDPEYPPKKSSEQVIVPSRGWTVQIPQLNKGAECVDLTKDFFFPEIAGPHELIINGIDEVRMAGPFGVGGRKYRIAAPSAPWKCPFHISSSREHKSFMIAFLALLISMIVLVSTIIKWIFPWIFT